MTLISNPYYLLPPLFSTAVSLILAVLVFRGSRRNISTWIFCGMLLAVAAWSFLIFGLRSSPDIHQALIWERAVSVASFTTFALYYHFTAAYTGAITNRQRGIIFSSYVFLLIATALSQTKLLIEGMRVEYYGYTPVLGPLAIFLGVGTIFWLGAGAYNLLNQYRRTFSYEEKNRILYLLIAVIFPVAGGMVDGFANLPPVSVWCNMIFFVLCSIAILKYHLLDIRLVAKKSLVYLLLSAIIAIPYVGTLLFLNQVLSARLEPGSIHVIIILFLAIVLRPLYGWAQRIVDRLFYRGRYDYLQALKRFAEETKSVLNLRELSSSMTQLVSGALCVPQVCLLLPSKSNTSLKVASCVGLDHMPSGVILRGQSPFAKWLKLNGSIMSSEELNTNPEIPNFTRIDKQNLEKLPSELYIPIKTRDGELSGLLILGEKLGGQSYSNEDKQLLLTITTQMAMALENAQLYEETRQSEKALGESEEKLRLIFESMTDGIVVADLDGEIIQVNEAAVRMHGCDNREGLIGQSLFEFMAKKDHVRVKESLRRTLENGDAKNVECTFFTEGRNKFPARLSATVLKDTSGSPIGFVLVTKDITERKQAEEREESLQQQLNLSSRLASVGELAAGVAHEINNPLVGIIGFSERLLRKSTDETSKRDLERIYNEASRVAKVVENLRTFARRKKTKREFSSINDILQKALEMRTYELKTSNIEVVMELPSTLPPVMVDFHQLQQVFLNIVLNAEQAMTEADCGGTLVIKAQEHKDYMVITFSDNGPGIANKNLDKIFDPFFTTRGEKGGTGLGLSICHGIVAEHDGKIYAKSKLGKGTTVFVELPLTIEKKDEDKGVEEGPNSQSK